MEEIGKNKTYCANVDIAHLVAADEAENRTNVGTGSTTNTAENLRKNRILCNFGAAVIQKNHMHGLFMFRRGIAIDPAINKADIRSQTLGSRVSGQNLQSGQGHIQRGNKFVQPYQGNMHTGKGSNHARIAFIGNSCHGCIFGNGKVAPRNSHIRSNKLAP